MRLGAMRESQEFQRIRSLVDAVDAPSACEVVLGPGDDAAIVRLDGSEALVLSSDLSVEDVHFRREWTTWESIGFRAIAAALSDLAAMAARPIGVLLSVAVPPEVDAETMDEMARGMGACLRRHGASLLGGDLSRSPGPVMIDVTVIGAAANPVERTGACPGDDLWVTGRLGGAASAAAAWSEGRQPDPDARRAFERPCPRTGEARCLRELADIHAMIDLSDGLAADAEQMAAASGVRLILESEQIPLHRSLENWAQPEVALAIAAGGGEDYELLVALGPGTADAAARKLAREFNVEFTRVGRVAEGAGVKWVGADGEIVDPPASGFDHFAGEA